MDTLERASQKPENYDDMKVVDRGSGFGINPPLIPAIMRGSQYMRGAMPGNMASGYDIARQTLAPVSRQIRPFSTLRQATDVQAPPSAMQAVSTARQQTSGLTLNDIANTPQYVKMPAGLLNADGTINLDDLKASLVMGDSPRPQVTLADFQELQNLVTSLASGQPQVTLADLNELKGAIAALDTPRSFQADIDQLNTLSSVWGGPQPVPINWATWVPTLAASGSMTISAATIVTANYVVLGSLCFFQIQMSCTLGGVADFNVYFTLPFPYAGGTATVFFTGYSFETQWSTAFAVANGAPSASQGQVSKSPGGVAWSLGTGRNIGVSGFYRID